VKEQAVRADHRAVVPFRLLHRLLGRLAGERPRTALIDAASLVAVLDLFEEHVYIGEVTAAGDYVGHLASSSIERFVGGRPAPGPEFGGLWARLIHPDDHGAREAFHRKLLAGAEAETTYRLVGLDGITRSIHDRARPVRRADGSVLVQGIVSDVTSRAEADARAAEAADRFFTLLDVVGEHVYVAAAHADGSIEELFQGPGADRLLGGAEPDEAMANWDAAIHPDDREAYAIFNARLARGERSEVEYRLRGADGVTRWVHDRAATRDRPDGTIEISGIVSDVTDRRRLEDEVRQTVAEMERAYRELEDARQAAEVIAHTDELTGTLSRRRFAALVATSGTEGRGLLLLDADHFKRINDHYGHAAGDHALVELAARIRGELGVRDLFARWGGEEFVILLAGVETDAALRGRAERIRAAVAARPVACGSLLVGLSVSIGAARGSRSLSLERLVDAADRALYAAKARGRDRVCLTSDSPIAASAEAPAPRGEEPPALRLARAVVHATSRGQRAHHDHVLAVADLCAAVAARLGLDAARVARSHLGGLLHDVGKVAVPDELLYKPGPLDPAEWDVMRGHSAHGEAIVLGFDALRDVAPVVRHHHERYDGRGYPDGLAGEAIPVEARIVAAADTYAAMTADRSYRAARSPREACDELRRSAGTQLDPRVVDALLEVLGAPASDAGALHRAA
jgi:diguanylate cyclase (GGDEF)-like protein